MSFFHEKSFKQPGRMEGSGNSVASSLLCRCIELEQWFSTEGDFVPRRHLAMFVDVFTGHNSVSVWVHVHKHATGI